MCGWFPPTVKASERSRTLPPACLFESRQEDRCSRKTPNQRLSICVPATPRELVFFWKRSCCFQIALWSERKFRESARFQHHNSYTRFPQMKARDPHADQSRGSRQGLPDPPSSMWPPSSNQSLSSDHCSQMICSLTNDVWPILK